MIRTVRRNIIQLIGCITLWAAIDIRGIIEGTMRNELFDKVFFMELVLLIIGQIIILEANKNYD